MDQLFTGLWLGMICGYVFAVAELKRGEIPSLTFKKHARLFLQVAFVTAAFWGIDMLVKH
ncbi:MAG: hypothetical protein WA459_00200 [Stellaceae bacterium]